MPPVYHGRQREDGRMSCWGKWGLDAQKFWGIGWPTIENAVLNVVLLKATAC